jgi:hypothetical protein
MSKTMTHEDIKRQAALSENMGDAIDTFREYDKYIAELEAELAEVRERVDKAIDQLTRLAQCHSGLSPEYFITLLTGGNE